METGALFGMNLANSPGDIEHDISIARGICRDDADTVMLSLAIPMTKRIDATWSPGDNGGGLDLASVAANATYHVHVIGGATVPADALFSTSPVNPLLPNGYSASRRVGSILTDVNANVCKFLQTGGWFHYPSTFEDLFGQLSTASAQVELTHLPLGIKVLADIVFFCTNGTVPQVFSAKDADLGDAGPNDGIGTFTTVSAFFSAKMYASSTRRISVRSGLNGQLWVYTRGWYDDRGMTA